MSQSRRHSLLEAVANTAAGFGLSVAAVAYVFPWVGVTMTMRENLAATSIMTVLSVVRSYVLRRVFNWWHVGAAR